MATAQTRSALHISLPEGAVQLMGLTRCQEIQLSRSTQDNKKGGISNLDLAVRLRTASEVSALQLISDRHHETFNVYGKPQGSRVGADPLGGRRVHFPSCSAQPSGACYADQE